MSKTPGPQAVLSVALLYFSGAALTCLFGRWHSGVAIVWVPGVILAAGLYRIERKHWAATLGACALANELAAGWVGMGWGAGLGFTLANLSESIAVALLARHAFRAHWPDATFELVSVYLLGALLVIPAGGALLGATTALLAGHPDFVTVFREWMLGHAVGLVAVLPFALAVVMRDRLPALAFTGTRRRIASVLMIATMVLLTLCVFQQNAGWALAAPLLFALFAAVWADALIATAMPMVVALVAVPLTATGFGPLASGAPDTLQLALLYAGVVACCSLPVVVEQARRRLEIARLSRRTAHFKAMSRRADSLIGELRRDALTDALTGLPNRRAFDDSLARQSASNQAACLAIIDIDHFKKVNDRLGHAAGDEVLRRFADMARASFRGGDMVARIGGEEFAVILRGVSIEQACLVCQRLTDRLSAAPIDTAFGPVEVTISTGIAAIGNDGDAAVIAADSALYAAKRAGRARLSSAA